MKRNILYLLSIGICLFTCVGSHAAAPETRAHLERGRSLFDHGRWTDARYELLKAREGADRDDRLTLQQIDYQLAVCALKLGSRDVEAMLADFPSVIPSRFTTTTCGSPRGCFIAAGRSMIRRSHVSDG